METSLKPRAVVLEDDPDFADGLVDLLEAVGFLVVWFRNALDATRYLLDQLAPSNPTPPALVVLDQHLVTPGQPTAEGWILAFLLRIGAQMGELQPCWIAAISNAIDERGRADRAREAQCDWITSKSNLVKDVPTWYQAVRRPAPDHTLPVEMIDLHSSAVAMLRWLAQRPQQPTSLWTADHVYNILGHRSSSIYLGAERRAEAAAFIDQLGGEAQALQYLWDGLSMLAPTQQDLLRRLLRGEAKKEIYDDDRTPRSPKTMRSEIKTICTVIAAYHNSKNGHR